MSESQSTTNALERLWRRLQMVVGRGRVKTGNDAGPVQLLQVQFSGQDVRDNTPRVAEYGFTSMPRPECQAVLVFMAGDRSNGVILGTNDEAARLKNLLPGEVAIYDDQGQSVYLTRAGIVMNGGGKPITVTNTPTITLDSPQVNATGAFHAVGNITSDADVRDAGGSKSMAGMRTVFNSHTQPVSGGTATAPGTGM